MLPAVSPHRLRFLILAGLVGANLFAWVLAGYSLLHSRQQHELHARTLTQNMAQAVDQSLSGHIGRIDLALRAIADEFERQLAGGRGLDPKAVDALLTKYQQRLPEVEAIRVSDADGRVIFGKGLNPAERFTWADRDDFTYLRDHIEGGLQVSPPRMGRVSKKLTVGFSRRYNHPDGRFAGVVSAPVAVDHFATFLSGFNVGAQGSLAVRHADLGLIARHPPIDGPAGAVGSTAVSGELAELARSGRVSATDHAGIAADGVARLATYRRIGSAPMAVIATVASDEYLAEWTTEMHRTVAGIAGFALLSLLAGGFLLRLLDRTVCETQMLQESEARQRLAASVFTHAHEGILISDARQIILDVNPVFSEITGYAREEAVGHTPQLLNSGRQDADFYKIMWQAIRQDGHWEGEIWNRRKDGTSYPERLTISEVRDGKGEVTHYIGTFYDISLLKQRQDQLEHLAHYDALTQLPNRTLFSDRMTQSLAQARRAGNLVAVCYLDLDGFKQINDECGHDGGDALLIEVARRLRDAMRAGDTVARLGGDEFVLLLGADNIEECDRVVTRILKALAAPILVKGQDRSVSGSIGITLFPEDDSDPDTLLRHADQAMYIAKQGGKNRYQMFDTSQNQRVRSRREAMEAIRRALENGEFCLHYQPIVDMREGRVLRFEGLIRWQHPQRGLLPPAEFLPVTEGTELDAALGRWVLSEGLRQLAAWRAMGLAQGLNLNISAGHLLAPAFAVELTTLLAATPALGPHALEIEIMEIAAIHDFEAATAVFQHCREAGIDVALDDFGTGYSSLSYFRRLPVDTLKIDQAFVQSVLGSAEDLAVVESVIGLTRAFSRKLVAEGVETVEIGMLLLNMGCSVGQGYGIARPMPPEAIPDWVAGFVPDPNWAIPTAHFAHEDMPLFMAELDHRTWVRRMQAWLSDDPDVPSSPALDGHLCRFGRWYSGPGKSRYGRFSHFQAMDAIHQAVHWLGQEFARLHEEGRAGEALARFGELIALRDRMIEQVHALQAEINVKQ
ncbi:MAG: EAL domain-containing protein [Rhodocyclaceae bacterium]|nr:EAL domain-containing protein [Rhodocyclaceae bacterium]